MNRFLSLYARLVASLGTVLLLVALALDPRWIQLPLGVVTVIALTAALRTFQIPLTKYSALNLLGMVAAGGAIIAGGPATALGLYVGVFATDWLVLRKAPGASAINGGREALALFGAYGFYAWFATLGDTADRGISTDAVPAVALLLAAHFLFSRGLLYCTLLIRDKLHADERSLIFRYEIIAFGAGTIGVLVSLFTISSVGWTGWLVVAFVLMFAGLLLKRILEEAVAAEELNKIHAMEQVVSSDANLGESLREIERLANRLVDWNGFRIWRLNSGSLRLIYQSGEGLLAEPRENGVLGGRLRDIALSTGEPVVIMDAARDARA
jgi:hypothetical protein